MDDCDSDNDNDGQATFTDRGYELNAFGIMDEG
jgi:hypothetical protein